MTHQPNKDKTTKPPKGTKARLQKRSDEIELLEQYTYYLEDQGYTDTDWRDEEPYAIDNFFQSRFYNNKLECVSELGHHWLPLGCCPANRNVCLFCGKITEK